MLAPMRQGLRITTGIEFADPAAPANDIQIRRDEAQARAGCSISARRWRPRPGLAGVPACRICGR